MSDGDAQRVLVIKLGALGNVVLSLGAFAAIRAHHAKAHISLLTTAPFAGWLAASPYFDNVLIDRRPSLWDLPGLLKLRRILADGRFDRVYDLQTSGRSSRYLRLFPVAARPEWSGIALGASHPDRNPKRNTLHDLERQEIQLQQAGIPHVPPPDLSWCRGNAARFGLPTGYVLLVPGSSAHRPEKRWPVAAYRRLAGLLAEQGLHPVVLGSAGEQALARDIQPAINLTGQTDFGDLCDLARGARCAVGNDTGPMHLIAAAGCPSVVLFSRASDPALCAPRGRSVTVLRRLDLADLDVRNVLAGLPALADA